MMLRWCFVLISCTVLAHQVNGAAIPIWELLSHEEKMGRLFYVFVHLVKQYCKTSDIPDCQKVLTLYGMSNLVSEDEHSLDIMDPYQRDAKIIVWEKIMRGEFKLPIKSTSAKKQHDEQAIHNEVYSTPYEVRVRPPANFVPVVSGAENELKSSPQSSSFQAEAVSEPVKESSGTVILRLGRSASSPDDSDSLISIPNHEAELLKRLAL